jgi:hypothetical protein
VHVSIGRRLGALEARLAPLRRSPDGQAGWLRWSTRGELDELEEITYAHEIEGRELTEIERLRAVEIEAAATKRQLAGEPSWSTDREPQRAEAEERRRRWGAGPAGSCPAVIKRREE